MAPPTGTRERRPLQVVLPMSGSGTRFARAGYERPKPMIDVEGRPLVAHLLERFPLDTRFVFVARTDHLEERGLRSLLESLAPGATVVPIAPHKRGPVHAVLAAEAAIDPALPTIVNYCDFDFRWDAEHFLSWAERVRPQGVVITYRGFHPHHRGERRYAYCRVDGTGRVVAIQEKQPFTEVPRDEHASTGTYWFQSGALALEQHHAHAGGPPDVAGEHYVSMVVDHLVRAGGDVRVYEVDAFCQWGTPEDLQEWEHWRRAFRALEASEASPRPEQPEAALLVPMAGEGRRVAAFGASKPLIEVAGSPMFLQAMAGLPRCGHTILAARAEDAGAVAESAPEAEVVVVDSPTEGGASTALLGAIVLEIHSDGPLWVTACDHGVVLTAEQLAALEASGCDAAVVGCRRWPPAADEPEAYSWIDAPADLAPVRAVGVKERVGEYVLVGSFWFRSRRRFLDDLRALSAGPIGPGGERHLDTIVPWMLEAGADVRLLESPAFFCWGTAEALRTWRYWHRHHRGFHG